jgi:hypothetical protein
MAFFLNFTVAQETRVIYGISRQQALPNTQELL